MKKLSMAMSAGLLVSCAHSVYKQTADSKLSPISINDARQFDASAKDAEIATFSDYFSFVGIDEIGHVAFAIDLNRDRYQKKYFADTFVALHEQHTGFVKLDGRGDHPNPQGELVSIPSSEYFEVTETANGGFQIKGKKDDLALMVDPPTQVTGQSDGSTIYAMRVAGATLNWRGRQLKGRVIIEHLVSTTLSKRAGLGMFGLLLRNSFGGGDGFQGLYLITDDGRDIYIQNSDMNLKNTNLPKMIGFVGIGGGKFDVSENLVLEVSERQQGVGVYRRPVAWKANWGKNVLNCRETTRKSFSNWFLGGFAMGIVEGEIFIDGVRHKVYGWSEIII